MNAISCFSRKKMPLGLAILLLPGMALTGQAPLETSSQVSAVTVYPSGAEVTRSSEIQLEAGRNELLFNGLPATLQDESLRMHILDNDGVTLEDIRTERVFLTEAANQRIRELEARINEVKFSLTELADGEMLLKERYEFLNQLRSALTSGAGSEADPRAVPTERWQELIHFWGSELEITVAEMREFREEKRELNARLDALNRELESLRSQAQREGRAVRIVLRASEAGQARIVLHYHVPDASWAADYRLDADATTRTAALELFALVRQATAEDWENAQLTVSTAQPAKPGTIPTLPPRYLTEREKFAPASFSRYRAEEAMSLAATDAIETKAAAVEQSLTSTLFHAPEPITIKSGDQRNRVFLARWELPGEWRHQAVPRARPDVFLTLKSDSPAEVPLPAGRMAIHTDGVLVSRSHLPLTLPGEPLMLSLGIDENVTIEWELSERFRDTAGLIQRRNRVRYIYEITVRNGHMEPIDITVTDRIPVSQDERITVQLDDAPRGTDGPSVDGEIEWTATIPSQETQTWNINYAVEHPQDIEVIGME